MDLAPLAAVVEELSTVDIAELGAADLADALQIADRLRSQVEGLNLAMLSALDPELLGSEGRYGTANWLKAMSGTSRKDAGARSTLATNLASMPHISSLLRHGKITPEHARSIARCVANPRARDAFDEWEEFSLGCFATTHTADQTASRVDRWIDHHDPDGTAPDDPTTDKVFVNRVGNRVILNADLCLETGIAVMALLEEQTDKVFHADRRRADEHEWSPLRRRPRSNQRAQALGELIGAGAAAPDNTARREPAFVVIEEEGIDGDPDYRLPDGSYVPRRLAAKWLGSAAMLRLVLCDTDGSRFTDRDGATITSLDLGRTQRRANVHQRRALGCRDGGCSFPGCDRPPAWTDAHHVTWWRDLGKTDMTNLGLLCRFHHTQVHQKRWIMTIGPGQWPRFTDLAGNPVVERRHRPPPHPAAA